MSDIKTMSLKDFFKETFSKEFEEEAEVEYVLAEIAGRAFQAKELSGLSYRDIARRMGHKSPAVVQRIVDKAEPHNITLSTLVRFSQACGFKLEVDFKPANERQHYITIWEHARTSVSPPKNLIEEIYATVAVRQQSSLEYARIMEFAPTPGMTVPDAAANENLRCTNLVG